MSSIHRLKLERKISCVLRDFSGTLLDVGGKKHDLKRNCKYIEFSNVKYLNIDPDSKPDYLMPLEEYSKIKNRFDVIICTEVGEYLKAPFEIFQAAHFLLNSGGAAIITLPSIMAKHGDAELDLWRFTESGIKELIDQSQFTRYSIEPIGTLSTTIFDLYRAQRTYIAKRRPTAVIIKIFSLLSFFISYLSIERAHNSQICSGYFVVVHKK